MKWQSIRTKVLGAFFICLVAGAAGIVMLMRYSFEHNSQALASESVSGARSLFSILQSREISKMSAVSETLMMNPEVQSAVAARDRQRLIELNTALYAQLKTEGVTNWVFHTPEPEMSVLLRVHSPEMYGDHLDRFMTREVARTHAPVAGSEMGKAGFAVRLITPFRDSKGNITGYVEFGEELGRFIHTMKEQTGNNYGLLLSKKFMNEQSWAQANAVWNRRDNWNDNPDFVVADKTTDSDEIIRFQGDFGSVPADGKVLERFQQGDSVYIRGIFPIRDASGQTVGAMFVVRDISSFYLTMRHTENVLVTATVLALILGCVLMLSLLNTLVFRRLEHIIVVATRVVGGDYDSEIEVSSDDEVGQFEQLFEQFRRVFVDVLGQLSELQKGELLHR